MKPGSVYYVCQKRIPVDLLPLLHDQITHHEPVFLDSLGISFLLSANQSPEDDIVGKAQLLVVLGGVIAP